MDETYDVVVIGGGAAGLSAAVALARFRRSVLVIDEGKPRNAPARHVHNFLTRDGTPPGQLVEMGRAEVERYGGVVEPGAVETVRREGDRFRVGFGGQEVGARRVLLAGGQVDDLPDLPGLAERWGRDVLHCPYCHGWEVRDQRIGVLVTSPVAVHQALLFRQLSATVILLQHNGPRPSDDELEQLHALRVPVVEGSVAAVESTTEGLTGVRLEGGRLVTLDALVVAPRVTARAGAVAELGLRPVDVELGGQVIGSRIEADPRGATSVPGVWAAGNITDPQAQVVSSAASGLAAGAAINADLIAEDARRAVELHRRGPIAGQGAWEEQYSSRSQNWSGRANPVLVQEISGATPGTALDAGCGEGGDALWLAAQGWAVTGADFSRTALQRGATHAERQGLNVTWQHLDLVAQPAGATYDLVTSHYLQLPAEQQPQLFRHLADAVAPGGTLLVVGHDLADLAAGLGRPGLAEMGWTATDVADELRAMGPGWAIEVEESRPRPVGDHSGHEHSIHDAVLRARRIPV